MPTARLIARGLLARWTTTHSMSHRATGLGKSWHSGSASLIPAATYSSVRQPECPMRNRSKPNRWDPGSGSLNWHRSPGPGTAGKMKPRSSPSLTGTASRLLPSAAELQPHWSGRRLRLTRMQMGLRSAAHRGCTPSAVRRRKRPHPTPSRREQPDRPPPRRPGPTWSDCARTSAARPRAPSPPRSRRPTSAAHHAGHGRKDLTSDANPSAGATAWSGQQLLPDQPTHLSPSISRSPALLRLGDAKGQLLHIGLRFATAGTVARASVNQRTR